ncbi:MAG: FHA domain-containing protein [Bacteroidota bacterium]|nr:FHA domain-containing protein [Bacteroidota bacterium]
MQRSYKFIITDKGKQIQKFAFEKDSSQSLIIGKNNSLCDITVNHNYISGTHLKLTQNNNNDDLFVEDLNSTNGVFINSKKVKTNQPEKIKIGDIISFMDDTKLQLLVLEPGEHKKKKADKKINKKLSINVTITIGRGKENDFQIPGTLVSRFHAEIKALPKNRYLITDKNSTNGTYINGRLLTNSKEVSEADVIKIGKLKFTPQELSTNTLDDKIDSRENIKSLSDYLRDKTQIIIGRDKKSDAQIIDNLISRRHASVTKENNKYFVKDLGSTNGTYVNGEKINKKTELNSNSELRIGLTVFMLQETGKELSDVTAIEAVDVSKTYPNGYVGMNSMSVNIPSKAFIALMGPSGCGKTTLMNALNGANPATTGKVLIHGLDLKKNYGLLKRKIGYVPQDDIVHKELSVNRSLHYAAKLRMNTDTTENEIRERINEVCENLGINDTKIRSSKVKDLSGGQRKRVSIAVELLNKPSILFLDEPTSPLDPETIDGFLNAIKNLTVTENTTVVMVTHKPEDLNYVDRVIFLGTKGYQAFYGEESSIYKYFGLPDKDIIGVYSLLSKPGLSKEWGAKWQTSTKSKSSDKKSSSKELKQDKKESLLKQFYWQTVRYANIKLNDKVNMALLMLQPIAIPLALIYLFSKLELGVLFMMSVSAIWFGVSNAAKEIVNELPIYERERMFNLNIFSYIFSKIMVLSVIALFQVIVFVFIIYLAYQGDPKGIEPVNILQMIVFMFYLTVSSTLMGLVLSAIFKTAEQAMTLLPLILIPQIIFAGVIADIDRPDKEVISYAMLGRWGTEGLTRIQNDNEDFIHQEYGNKDSIIISLDNEMVEVPQLQEPFEPRYIDGNQYAKYEMKSVEKRDTLSVCESDQTSKSGRELCVNEIHSVYMSVPNMITSTDSLIIRDGSSENEPYSIQDGNKFVAGDPLKSLGFYEKDDLINAFDSLKMNILAISILNILFLMLIFLFLKKKDTI